MSSLRTSLPALLAAVLLACGPAGHGTGPHGPNPALAGLPPHTDPPLALDDDDDLTRARQQYDALAEGDPARAQRRGELWAAYASHIQENLDDNMLEQAFEQFDAALGMWTPHELSDDTKPAPAIELVAPTAEKLYDMASRAGLDAQAVTALAVLRAAYPDRKEALQTAFDTIVTYADDLEVARSGPGAEGARPIKMLEESTRWFASPWACLTLADLYLDRQAARVQSMGQNDEHMEGAHGPGIRYPTLMLIRVYARMDRLDAVPDVLDTLAGQLGDDEKLRTALRQGLAPGAEPTFYTALAAAFSDDTSGGEPDLVTAWRICEAGGRKHPKSAEPRRCLGVVALQSNNLPVATRELEAAYQLEPSPPVGNLLVRLYHFRLNDQLRGERLDAARAELKHIEAFHAALAKAAPPAKKGEPAAGPVLTEVGVDDAYLIMGSGLYALGEIDEGLSYLKKANAIKPNYEALELIATIEHKRGEWTNAARDYEAAAALPRDTPLEAKIDQARLLRLAADARNSAGDAKNALGWYRAALDKWDEILGSGLSDRERVAALTERGRLLWDIGQEEPAMRSFEAAIDSAGQADAVSSAAYSDVIAFLYPRGRYEAALDAYHRGLARQDVTEYFKIYCSLWIVGAARMKGLDPDPLAIDYLSSRKGTRWYHQLARFTTGQVTYDQLLEQANTRGKRCEAYFYQGIAKYAAGERKAGDELMTFVVDTDMLGFFEYDMARYMLEHGPPTK